MNDDNNDILGSNNAKDMDVGLEEREAELDSEFNDSRTELPDAAEFEELYIKEHASRIALIFENQQLRERMVANQKSQENDPKVSLEEITRQFEAMREAKELAERQAQEQAALRAADNQASAERERIILEQAALAAAELLKAQALAHAASMVTVPALIPATKTYAQRKPRR